ncbi:YfbM family protein [Actinomadura violacea]|uniref:YfbM family protein n=1 Tax=Actinomadura violacea TaxID=2819934 RepID=A0ABS3S7B8_9ACTN|nr:YfbM family protein [Actinomadura violacea]MBO2464896.1 YfbM family protein [Actinomadura violacea]
MLGVHFALTADQERALLSAEGDANVGEVLEDIEENWAEDDLSASTDKAWDAIHRSLGNGSLDPDGGRYPLSHAILGGRHLHEEYYVVYVTAAEARDVNTALNQVDEGWLRRRFDAIDDPDYNGPQNDEDFSYTWQNFLGVRVFYERAANAGRAVLFTAT